MGAGGLAGLDIDAASLSAEVLWGAIRPSGTPPMGVSGVPVGARPEGASPVFILVLL